MRNDIYTLAHEIKNPLCVVKGYLEMINETNLSKYKEIINNQVNDSLSVLNDYLEYNRISLNKEEIDLNLLLEDIKSDLMDFLKNKNVLLNIDLLDDDVYLQADYNKLKQVFNNISQNNNKSSCNETNGSIF